jgi:hypothetical protein
MSAKTTGRYPARLTTHIALAMVGSTAVGFILVILFSTLLRGVGIHGPALFDRLIFDVPYGAFFWGTALLLGFVADREMQDRSACWVGLLGLVLLFLMMLGDVSGLERSQEYRSYRNGDSWQHEYDQLLSLDNGKCGDSECLGKLLFTTPAVNSIAYSIGAWLALRSRKTKTADQRQGFTTRTNA